MRKRYATPNANEPRGPSACADLDRPHGATHCQHSVRRYKCYGPGYTPGDIDYTQEYEVAQEEQSQGQGKLRRVPRSGDQSPPRAIVRRLRQEDRLVNKASTRAIEKAIDVIPEIPATRRLDEAEKTYIEQVTEVESALEKIRRIEPDIVRKIFKFDSSDH